MCLLTRTLNNKYHKLNYTVSHFMKIENLSPKSIISLSSHTKLTSLYAIRFENEKNNVHLLYIRLTYVLIRMWFKTSLRNWSYSYFFMHCRAQYDRFKERRFVIVIIASKNTFFSSNISRPRLSLACYSRSIKNDVFSSNFWVKI